jgi:hypothetical protein
MTQIKTKMDPTNMQPPHFEIQQVTREKKTPTIQVSEQVKN